ncbi:MAG: aldehyde ferredoxin oxidoreductase N-terminal domain-containing protein [Planctomycetota bacterium]
MGAPQKGSPRNPEAAGRRRVLVVDLHALEGPAGGPAGGGALGAGDRAAALAALARALERSAAVGGLGLAHEALLRAGAARGLAAAPGPTFPAQFALAVGDAVRRGVPTAQRVSLLARVPSTGRLADGQVGGDLGARLAGVCELLLLVGSTSRAAAGGAAVLVLDPHGVPRLEAMPELRGARPSAKRQLLRARFGSAGGLCIGPAGEAGAPLANVANLEEPTSFVGRGGLGLAFGATGLVALVVQCSPDPRLRLRSTADDSALRAALERSPRLIARAEGGTLELAEDLAARGAPGAAAAQDAALAARAARTGRHGCRGCPTPCGWVLDGGPGPVRGGRFGALAHLAEMARNAPPAAEASGDVSSARYDARALLAACDDLGLDAKGATLAVARLAPLAPMAALGLLARGDARAEQLAALFDSRAPDQRDEPVARLARCVAGPGRDPMRVGLALADAADERVARALAPLPWPPAGHARGAAAGLGRFVWWHECLAAALDAHGFCAFSAAGLLADGVLTLDELAAALLGAPPIAPHSQDAPAPRPSAALLEAGAWIVAARHALAPPHARLGRAALRHAALGYDRTARATDGALEAPGALPEYRSVAGLTEEGELEGVAALLDPERWTSADGGALGRAAARLDACQGERDARVRHQGAAPESGDAQRADHGRAAAPPAQLGSVVLAGGPALQARLGGELTLDLPLPATIGALLAAAERARPEAQGWLVRDGQPLPAVFRRGERVAVHDLVVAGDRLDLVLVVAGG